MPAVATQKPSKLSPSHVPNPLSSLQLAADTTAEVHLAVPDCRSGPEPVLQGVNHKIRRNSKEPNCHLQVSRIAPQHLLFQHSPRTLQPVVGVLGRIPPALALLEDQVKLKSTCSVPVWQGGLTGAATLTVGHCMQQKESLTSRGDALRDAHLMHC